MKQANAFPGTTSAYAENTPSSNSERRRQRNYLRVRGEYLVFGFAYFEQVELPPRTRRILTRQQKPPLARGTTSAYAENTTATGKRRAFLRNYLRVRGEYI